MASFSKYAFFVRVNITSQRKTTKNDQIRLLPIAENNHARGFLCLDSFDGTEEVSRY